MLRQRGSSASGMVMILMLAAILVMHGNLRQLSAGWFSVVGEQHFIRQQVAASSALAWGIRRHWRAAAGWHCQFYPHLSWRACLLMNGEGNEGVIRGDSGAGSLSVWRWIELRRGLLRPKPRGWIDYCPLTQDCQP
ncbi:hypothetical protein BTJ39_13030 [Izhakiella australiensis]|uniref:DUF2509 domain-containing protein n=1 Tax=Izhakiella australiensis TaxID=1926881 RepID=A0A1S8YLK7_9GAMM|nr:DUF2509 family protein [Izhakiella australiensis]OON39573.1 hypothetical protein BTJ39_13030 [Izhakiella australiensis]